MACSISVRRFLFGVLVCSWTVGAIAPTAAAGLNTKIPLNVNAMPVVDLLKLLATEQGLSLAVDPQVMGNVTIFTEGMPVHELLDLAVDMVGAAKAERDGVILVMPEETFQRRFGVPYRDPTQNRVLSLRNAPIASVTPSLRALQSKLGSMVEDPRTNSLLVIDVPEKLDEIERFVLELDRPVATTILPLEHISPEAFAQRLREQVSNSVQIVPDIRGSTVMVRGTTDDLKLATQFLELLDRPANVQTRTLPLSFAVADSIEQLLRPLLTPNVGTIFVDPSGHSVFATDFPAVLDTLERRLHQLDAPPRQVLIEARIIQLTRDDELRVGINWEFLQDELNVRGSFPALADDSEGIEATYDALESKDYEIVLQALSTYGKTDLLSSPRIVVTDGGKGSIHVGTQFPYITVDSREGSSGTIDRFEKVTVVSTGVKLNVEARIHADHSITMDLHPEVSSVTGFNEGVPIIETSTAESRMSVPNRRSVIFGGLNRKEQRDERRGVPILRSIPLLKYLFSSVERQSFNTELVILLRPTIVSGFEDQSEWYSDAVRKLQEPQ